MYINTMKNLISVDRIGDKLMQTARRFPISVALTAGFAALQFSKTTDIGISDSQLGAFLLYGTIISAAAALWLEDFIGYRKQLAIIAAITLLWGVYCFFLPVTTNPPHWHWLSGGKLSESTITNLKAIGIAAFLSMLFIPFLKKGKDDAFWHFTMQMAVQAAMTIIFTFSIFIGLYIANHVIFELLVGTTGQGQRIYDMETKIRIFCFDLFAPLYFLSNIPDKIAKHSEKITLNKFFNIFTMYILMPIAAIYTVILYAYLSRIISVWELPRGLVSYMVSAIAFMGLTIAAVLYPARTTLPRYFGLMILPLLVLMTIGITRRIDDYGLTVARCHILLLNIWFYGIYAYLFITEGKRIKWVLISFAAIALAASVGPWSVTNVTKRVLIAEVNRYLEDTEAVLEEDDKKMIRDKLRYLSDTYGKLVVQDMNIDSLRISRRVSSDERRFHISQNDKWDNEILDIDNFNTFVYLDYRAPFSIAEKENPYHNIKKGIRYSFEKKLMAIEIQKHAKTFTVPLPELIGNRERIYQGDDYTILITTYNGRHFESQDSVVVEAFRGYLFYNR